MVVNALTTTNGAPIGLAKPEIASGNVIDSSWRLAQYAASSNIARQKNAYDAFFIIMYGYELGISPMAALRTIYSIDGTPVCSGEAMLALIRKSGLSASIRMETGEQAAKVYMKRRDTDEEYTATFSLDDAKRANLLGKKNWQMYPKKMMLWRAVSECAKVLFGDVIGGLYTLEEIAPDTEVSEVGEPVGKIVVSRETTLNEPPQQSRTIEQPDPIEEGEIVEEPQTSPGRIYEYDKQQPPPEQQQRDPKDVLGAGDNRRIPQDEPPVKDWYTPNKAAFDAELAKRNLTYASACELMGEQIGVYFSTGKAALNAIDGKLKAAKPNGSGAPAQPPQTPPPAAGWTDESYLAFTNWLMNSYNKVAPEMLLLTGKKDWRADFASPDAARAEVRRIIMTRQLEMVTTRMKYIPLGKGKAMNLICDAQTFSVPGGRTEIKKLLGDDGEAFAKHVGMEDWTEGNQYDNLPPLKVVWAVGAGKDAKPAVLGLKLVDPLPTHDEEQPAQQPEDIPF